MTFQRISPVLGSLAYGGALLALLFAISVSAAPQFQPVIVTDINLRMDDTDARVLFHKETFDKSSFAVTLVDGDKLYPGRIKVLGSFTRRLPKKSLYIKLDHKARWEGQNRLALNALASDPSLLRNWLAWGAAHAMGSPGPTVRFRRIFINGELKGIYMQDDWVEPKLFERYDLGSDGQLYQPDDSTYCGDFSTAHLSDVSYCWNKFSPPDNNFSALEKLIRDINSTPIADFDKLVEKNFDVDSLINWFVLNVLTDDGDTYNKNFFLYYSTVKGKWVVIPWDYDLSFGRTYDPTLPFPKNIYNDNFQYYYSPELGAPSPLKEKTLSNPKLNAMFLARMAHMLGLKKEGDRPNFGWFSYDNLAARIDYLQGVLAPEVAQDPYLRTQHASFNKNIDAIKYFVEARTNYLATTLFGNYPWNPKTANWNPDLNAPPSPLPTSLYATGTTRPGDSNTALMVDGYGYLLALIHSEPGGRLLNWFAQVDMVQPPAQVPPGYSPKQCIQRSWYVALKTPGRAVRGIVTLEYLQETTQRSELGNIKDEDALQLWRYEEGRWQQIPTVTNDLVNTLTTKDEINLVPGRLNLFVACPPLKH